MSIRPALVPPSLVFALSPEACAGLLEALGAPADLRALSDEPLALARALFERPLSTPIAAALHAAAALAGPTGRRALVEARMDLEGGLDSLDDGASDDEDDQAAAFAALAIARVAARDVLWERTVDRAFVRLERELPEPIAYELWARAPIAIDAGELASLLDALPASHRASWVVEDAFGVLQAAAPYAGGRETRLYLGEKGKIERRDFSPLRADVVALDPRGGRVRITTSDPPRARLVAEALAERGKAAIEALLNKPSFTLKPLFDLGEAGLAKAELPPRVHRVRVVACQALDPDAGRVEFRSKDALGSAIEHAAKHGGYLHRATLRLAIDGAERPVDAFVELPNRIAVADARFYPEVLRTLDALGLRSPGVALDDLTTLGAGPRPEWRWREAFGDAAVLAMKSAKLLALVGPGKSPAVALIEMRALGHTLRAFPLHHPLDEGMEYALADDLLVPARTVGPKDRETWQLDRARLAEAFAKELGLDRSRPCEGLPEGVVDLGLPAGDRARVLYVLTPVPESARERFAGAIAKAVLPAHAVLLVPRGRAFGPELTVELDPAEQVGLRPLRDKLEALLEARGLRGPPGAAPAATEITLSLPGAFMGKRAVVEVDGAVHAVQERALVLLLAAAAAATRSTGAWASYPPRITPQGAHEAVSRLHTDLKGCLPRGVRLLSARQDGCRLGPGVKLGAVAWEAYDAHPDARIRKLAAQRPKKA